MLQTHERLNDLYTQIIDRYELKVTHVTHPAEESYDSLRLFDEFDEIESRSCERGSVRHTLRLHRWNKHTLSHTHTNTRARVRQLKTQHGHTPPVQLLPQTLVSDSRMSRSLEPALFDDSGERNERFINRKTNCSKEPIRQNDSNFSTMLHRVKNQ